jgi:hypothetical protein
MRLPSMLIVLILKSMPMVVMKVCEKVFWQYLSNKQVLPTPAPREGARCRGG